jgi:hypothetical protein
LGVINHLKNNKFVANQFTKFFDKTLIFE